MEEKSKIFLSYLNAISHRNIDDLKVIIDAQAKFEYPYALPATSSIIHGVEGICTHLLKPHFSSTYLEKKLTEIPHSDLLIAELESTEFYPKTSKSYHQNIISLVTIRDHKIHHYKEFFNPVTRLEGLLDLETEGLD